MTVIDLTEIRKLKEANPSPCDGCEVGSVSIGQYIDPATGHLMQETIDCHDTCRRFNDYIAE